MNKSHRGYLSTGIENHVLWVHTGHMRTRLRRENANTRLQVPMGKTPKWCERRQLWAHTHEMLHRHITAKIQ
jgi:hypothetical protein